jgi:hypothetical protein
MFRTSRNPAARCLAPVLCPLLWLISAPALPAQDLFEPNDSCGAAAVLPLGPTTMLTLGPDDDYYVIAVPANARIEVSALAGVNQLDVELHEVGCPTPSPLASSSGAPLLYADCGGAARDLVIKIPAGAAVDLAYELMVSAAPIVDDVYEPNDACVTGTPSVIRDYAISDLVVTRCNDDWWAIAVQPNNYEVQIEAVYDPGQTGLDLELFDDGCTSILSSTTTLHGKALRFVNTTAMAQIIKVRVSVTPGHQLVDYSLSTCFGGALFTPLIGHQACIGVPNSTSAPAGACAWGDTNFAPLPDIHLYVGDLPANSFGYFIASETFLFVMTPGNTVGNLCLGTPGRYSFDILDSGAGFVSYEPDPMLVPLAGGGFSSIQPGDRWYWQYWYRDSIGGNATSNFSSALYIEF